VAAGILRTTSPAVRELATGCRWVRRAKAHVERGRSQRPRHPEVELVRGKILQKAKKQQSFCVPFSLIVR